MQVFRKFGADISLCREWFTTEPVQPTIGLRAIVLRVIVRKGIVPENIFAGAAIFRGPTRCIRCILHRHNRTSACVETRVS
jgi:hypothetical protein